MLVLDEYRKVMQSLVFNQNWDMYFSLTFKPSQIVFDECHKAKNATSTKMGKAVLDLQNKLPRARVVYASATGLRTNS